MGTKLIESTKKLYQFWGAILVIQFFLFVIVAVINAVQSDTPSFKDFLTLIHGFKTAKIAAIISLIFIILDFYQTYSFWKQTYESKYLDQKQQQVIKQIQRYLKYILFCLILTGFAQILEGIIWGCTGIALIVLKCLCFKKMEYLERLSK